LKRDLILIIAGLAPLTSLTTKGTKVPPILKTRTVAQNSRPMTLGSRPSVALDHHLHQVLPDHLPHLAGHLFLHIHRPLGMRGHRPLHHLPDPER
jgi:hypothetical protein